MNELVTDRLPTEKPMSAHYLLAEHYTLYVYFYDNVLTLN